MTVDATDTTIQSVRCTGERYPVNPDVPGEGTDVRHTSTCPVHSDLTATTVTLPMAGIGESITIRHLPTEWAPVLTKLADEGVFSYGSNYTRQSAENLRDMARMLSFGDIEAATHWFDRIQRRHGEVA